MIIFPDLNALPCYEHEIVFGQQPVKENLSTKSLSVNTEPGGITDWSEHRLGMSSWVIKQSRDAVIIKIATGLSILF